MMPDRLGGGPIVIDQAPRSVFTHHPSAYLSLRRLADGEAMSTRVPF